MKHRTLALIGLVLVTMLVTVDASAQGRGRGRGNSGWGKKCEKFVNCHDARDGRWDNRGPRRRALQRSRYYSPYNRTRVYRQDRYRRSPYDDRVYLRRNRR